MWEKVRLTAVDLREAAKVSMREDKRANALMRIAEAKEKQHKKRMLAQGMSRVKAKKARKN